MFVAKGLREGYLLVIRRFTNRNNYFHALKKIKIIVTLSLFCIILVVTNYEGNKMKITKEVIDWELIQEIVQEKTGKIYCL